MEEDRVMQLSRTLHELQDYADTLLALKAKGDSSSQLPAAYAAGTALLLRTREQERSAALHAARLKEGCTGQRNTLDHDSLQLHNLLYEQQYYDKEIAACRAFTSAYTEQQIGSITPLQQVHGQELERLTTELQQRQALQQQLQQLQQQKEQLLRERNRVSTTYAELRQQVEICHKGNKALAEATQPNGSTVQADAETAQLLPLPLYIIYIQAAAAANVVGLPLKVTIEGNPAVAKQQQQQLLTAQQGTEEAHVPPSSAPQDAKRRRKQLQQEDQAYQLHPLSVRLDVFAGRAAGADSSSLATSLTFYFYSQLKLVGVLAATPEDQELITNLFMGDTGDGSMLENVGICSTSSTLEFAAAGRPCPFRWAQELGGVDVLGSLPSSYTSSSADQNQLLSALSAYRHTLRLETFVDRLAAAKAGRQQLKRILSQLALKEQPPCGLSTKHYGRLSTYIHSWKHLADTGVQLQQDQQQLLQLGPHDREPNTWQPLQQYSVQEEGEVAGDGAADTAADATAELLHLDTAEEDLLQGLLEDDRATGAGSAGPVPGDALLEHPGTAVVPANDPQRTHMEDDFTEGFRELATEASAGSELLPGDDLTDTAGGVSSGVDKALSASHSLYRLVLKAPALEVHLHVKVYYNYPLCPPVFAVTKMLNSAQRGDPVPLTDVNEVLKLQQQANLAAVQDAVAMGLSQTLPLQVFRLRQCSDALSAMLRSQHSKDLVDNLKAKQLLQGRDRQPRVLTT